MASMENPLSILIRMDGCFLLSNSRLTVSYQATASSLSLSKQQPFSRVLLSNTNCHVLLSNSLLAQVQLSNSQLTVSH